LAVPSAAAADASQTTQVVVPRGQPVQIAFADDLTGSASGFATSLANAVAMAVDAHPAIRGFPIQINLVDAPCGDPAADLASPASLRSHRPTRGGARQLSPGGVPPALP